MEAKHITVIAVALLIVIAGFVVLQDKTHLTVNGEEISKAELKRAAGEGEINQNVIDSVANYHLLAQEAGRQGIIVSEEDVDLVITNTVDSLEGQSGLASSMDMTVSELRNKIRNDILVSKLLGRLFNQISTNETEARELYEANIETFSYPQYVYIRQIFIDTTLHDNLDELADEAILRLKTEEFCAVAESLSDETEKCKVFLIEKGTLFPEYEQAAFTQDVSGASLIRSDAGIHIVQTLEKGNFATLPFETIGKDIVQSVTTTKRTDAYKALISNLRENARIDYHI